MQQKIDEAGRSRLRDGSELKGPFGAQCKRIQVQALRTLSGCPVSIAASAAVSIGFLILFGPVIPFVTLLEGVVDCQGDQAGYHLAESRSPFIECGPSRSM